MAHAFLTWWQVLTADKGLAKAILVTIVCQVCLYCSRLYDLRIVSDHRELFVRSLQALGATSLALAGLYYWFPDLIIGRGVFLISATFLVTVILGLRVAFVRATRQVGTPERRERRATRLFPVGAPSPHREGCGRTDNLRII